MPDTRYWILDTGYWILDAGYWMPDTGCRILDAGYWMLDKKEMEIDWDCERNPMILEHGAWCLVPGAWSLEFEPVF